MRRPPHLGACGIGHVLGSCIMVVPAYASDNEGVDFQQFIDEFAGRKDFFEFVVSVAALIVSVAAAAFAYRQVEEAKLATERAKLATEQAKRQADEAKLATEQAKRQADEAFKASPEGKIQAAVAKAMEPFEPTRKKDEVIKRTVMETIKTIQNPHQELERTCDHPWWSLPIRQVVGSRRSLARSARCCAIHHRKRRLEDGDVRARGSG